MHTQHESGAKYNELVRSQKQVGMGKLDISMRAKVRGRLYGGHIKSSQFPDGEFRCKSDMFSINV